MEGVSIMSSRDALASLLGWWREAGVDTLVEDAPRDWLARPRIDVGHDSEPRHAAPPPVSAMSAQEQPALPATLPELLAWMRDGADVPEARWGRTRILPSGDLQSGLMILTDMPEPGDAEAGRLLAGEIGELFDKMLAAIGRSRETIWLAPIASIRSVGRVPAAVSDRLIAIARHQVALVAPKRLLIMGETPNRALIGDDWQQRRGDYHRLNFGGVVVEAVPTFHPRMLNDRPAYKKAAWADLQLVVKDL